MRVRDDPRFASREMLVDENGIAIIFLFIERFQDSFTLEHDGEDVGDIAPGGVIFLDEAAEETFGVVFFDGFGRRGRGQFEDGLPRRERLDVIVALAP